MHFTELKQFRQLLVELIGRHGSQIGHAVGVLVGVKVFPAEGALPELVNGIRIPASE